MDPSLTFLVVVSAWLLGWMLLWRVPRPPAGDDGPLPRSTVLVPARDEELSLPHLLDALDADHDPYEMIVLDDGSTDRTAGLARARGVEVIAVPSRPAGWAPKNWALHHGLAVLERAGREPEVAVFLDADVRPTPGLIGDLVRRAATTGGLVSVQPWHHTERIDEQLSAPFNTVIMMGVGAAAPAALRLETRGAFGPVLATRLDVYREVGGHAAVSDDVVEDMALAERYRRARRPVEVYGGRDRISFRMFPTGPRQLIEGWSKNMASGSGRLPRWRTLAIVVWVTAALQAVIGTLGTAFDGRVDLWLLLAVAFALQIHHHQRQLGDFRWWTIPAYPVLLVGFIAIYLYSAYRLHVRRSVVWRGRVIPMGRSSVPAP